jgi:holo-[acyl-carrier protein] synthase
MKTSPVMPLHEMDLAVSDALSQLSQLSLERGHPGRGPGPGHSPGQNPSPSRNERQPGHRRSGNRDQCQSSFRVGVDLVTVADVAASVRHFGDRYVNRIFTPHEVACCQSGDRSQPGLGGYSIESLAARFAAKEAVVKVLRPKSGRPDWRSIEVHRASSGSCEIRLSGQAARLAADAGIDELAVSLTHEGMTAAAVVVGVCGSRRLPSWHSMASAGGKGERWTRPFDLS